MRIATKWRLAGRRFHGTELGAIYHPGSADFGTARGLVPIVSED